MSNTTTPRLSLPFLAAGQAQKHITVNEALGRLDGLVQLAVQSRTVAAQPASPADGAMHILPTGATGAAWFDKAAGLLAHYVDGVWAALTPRAGWLAWIIDEGLALIHDGENWTPLSSTFKALTAARSPFFAATRFEILEQEVTLSGASVATTVMIPARAIVLGVSTRTSAAITGATSYSCGVAGEAAKFGGALGVAKNASNVGVIGPTAYYADTPVVITSAGGAFTGGKVRVSIHAMRFDPPAAV
ncbi:ribonuclease III [Caulobacter sp. Root656]|nr:ribonuclease III [Caulobacter sp. Root656]